MQDGNNTLDNYIITYKDGKLIVNPKEVKVALASSNISKTYDGQSAATPNDFTYTGFVQGESLEAGNVLNFAGTNDLAITKDGQPSDGIDVGSYQVKIGKIGVTATDYTFVADDTSSATLEITPHLVKLKANDDTIVKNNTPYKAGTKGFSYLTGFVGNDTAESLGLSTSDLNFGNKAGTTDGADGATLAGKYNIYLDGSWSSKNYEFAYEPGQLIITTPAPSVTPQPPKPQPPTPEPPAVNPDGGSTAPDTPQPPTPQPPTVNPDGGSTAPDTPQPPTPQPPANAQEALEAMQAVHANIISSSITINRPDTAGDSTIKTEQQDNLPQYAVKTIKLEGLPVFIDDNLIEAKDSEESSEEDLEDTQS